MNYKFSYIVVDFETKDPNIDTRSWPCGECTPLGVALLTSDGVIKEYCLNMERAKDLISSFKVIVCHNAMYDCGILVMLGYDIYQHIIIDTAILARVWKNTLPSLKLEYLGKELINEIKETKELEKLAYELKDRELLKFTSAQKPLDVLYKNMDIAQKYGFDIVEKYALKDVDITNKLYEFFLPILKIDYDFYSDLIKYTIKSRAAGVLLDFNKGDELVTELKQIMDKHQQDAFELVKRDFNFNSSHDFIAAIESLGIKLPVSEKGNKTCDADFMHAHKHPVFAHILYYKKLNNVKSKITSQWKMCSKDSKIFPPQIIHGAAATGRFSGRKPNIFNIPRRDKVVGPLCRQVFIAPPGKLWVCGDFKSQEPKLAIHFASKINAPGVWDWVDRYNENPDMDIYIPVAKECGIERDEAKTVFLAYMYGQSYETLAELLNSTKEKANYLKNLFKKKYPFIHYLNLKLDTILRERDYLVSLNRRKIYQGTAKRYKMTNYLIQGSAADQMNNAIVALYNMNIDIMFNVYDELNCLIDEDDLDKVDLIRNTMETSTQLVVPSTVDIKYGKSWSECK